MLGLALDQAFEILRLDLKPSDKNFGRVLSSKQSVVGNVLTAAVRIDETRLKKRATDQLDEILDLIRSEQKAKTIEGSTV